MGPRYTDSHVHFWDTALRPYPWLAEVPAIAGAHGPGDLERESAPDTPERVVFVQADCSRPHAADEVAWVESMGAVGPRVAGIVAFAAMDRGAATEADLKALSQRPLVKGVRHLIQGERDPRFCLSKAFMDGVRTCGERGLTFDLCVRHFQLEAVVALVRGCPGTTFVLDHAGKPDLATPSLDPWRAHIRDLSLLPNTLCKLSGIVTEAGGAPLDGERFQPVVGHLLETFGPGRLLFGSDWPVVKLACAYPRWLSLARQLLSHLPASEQDAIFHSNAGRGYRLS